MNLLHGIPPEVFQAYFNDFGIPDGSQDPTELAPGGTVCAEDPYWEEGKVLRLSRLCVRTLARFFSRRPMDGLCLTGPDRSYWLDMLSLDEPLSLTADKLHDQQYWRRCCKEKLKTCDVSLHGGCYKRLYLESHVQEQLETFRPLETDIYDIKDLLSVVEDYIKRLEINELLPPVIHLPSEDGNDDLDDAGSTFSGTKSGTQTPITAAASGSQTLEQEKGKSCQVFHPHYSYSRANVPIFITAEPYLTTGLLSDDQHHMPDPAMDLRIPNNHIDFGTILPCLKELQELSICYQVRHCGIDFRWDLFGMTAKDSDNLALGLKNCKKLRAIKIRNSQVDDDKFYAIYDGLRYISDLEHLGVPNNMITDESIESIVKIMLVNINLKELDLTNNQITCEGAKELAKHISSPKCRLQKLILSLNLIRDEGCEAICQALNSNHCLSQLDLSSNRLTAEVCPVISRLLKSSRTLKSLTLTCNNFGESGAQSLLDGLKFNDALVKLDIRLTGCGKAVDLAVNDRLRRNKQRLRSDRLRMDPLTAETDMFSETSSSVSDMSSFGMYSYKNVPRSPFSIKAEQTPTPSSAGQSSKKGSGKAKKGPKSGTGKGSKASSHDELKSPKSKRPPSRPKSPAPSRKGASRSPSPSPKARSRSRSPAPTKRLPMARAKSPLRK